jgi:teichuronic acid biosynthesis glycosyltransferase TuaG
MKISVIIPFYNSKSYIDLTLRSILLQTYPINEIILIDDLSSDNTSGFIIDFFSFYNFTSYKIIYNDINLGPGECRNIGINFSKNSIIAFCDADDIWEPNKIEKQIYFLNEYPIVASSYIVKSSNNSFREKIINLGGIYNYNNLIYNNYLAMSTVIINTKIIKKNDLIFTNVVHEDYLLWLSLFKKYKGLNVFVTNETLMVYIRRSSSFSKGYFKKFFSTYHVYRVHGYSKLKSIFFTVIRVMNSFKRYI